MNENSNTLETLLSGTQLADYKKTEYPFNLHIIHKALVEKLKEDPNYEVWVPFVYVQYSIRFKNKSFANVLRPQKTYISNLGRLFVIRKGEYRPLSINEADGYPTGSVYCGKNNVISFRLHRALGCCFVPIKEKHGMHHPKDLQINHISGIKNDYSLINLEWCTPSDNIERAIANSLLIYKKGEFNKKTKPVRGVVEKGKYKGYSFLLFGLTEYTEYGFTQSKISACCLGKENTHKNCSWSYATKNDLDGLTRPLPIVIKETIEYKQPPNFTLQATNLETSKTFLITDGINGLKEFGFLQGCVWNVLSGHAKSHKGHSFIKIEH